MAAGGYKEFVAGETLDQDEINDFLMQGMLVFAGTAARGSAIGTPVEGQFSFLKDSDSVEFFDGSAWTALSSGLPMSGGLEINSGGYRYHIFRNSGTLTVSSSISAEYAMLGGGGGGGFRSTYGGGGGGAGGLLAGTATFPAGDLTVVVGAGGAGANASGNPGVSGEDSYISSVGTAIGGGRGGTQYVAGGDGGSGGGGSTGSAGGSGTAGQGQNGGSGSGDVGGSGGGFTNAGAPASSGGNGTDAYSTWLTLWGAGELSGGNYWVAGGGGGSGNSTYYAGGLGGGGTGVGNAGNQGQDGDAFTGGGGGGTKTLYAGDGGKGWIMVRYAI